MNATELIYTAAGSPMVEIVQTEGICAVCGKEIDEGVPIKKVVSSTFMDWNVLADMTAPHVCKACKWCIKEPKTRRSQYIATKDELICFKRDDIEKYLFNPPEPPFVFFVTSSYKKHGSFWAQVNYANPDHIFVEMGVKQTPGYIDLVDVSGFSDFRYEWNVFYASIRPNKLLYFSKIGGFTGDPEGMKNEPMTRHVFEYIAKPGEIVLDPCVGLGMTARMAHRFGMICYGIELNPARLEKTLGWLVKQGYDVDKI